MMYSEEMEARFLEDVALSASTQKQHSSFIQRVLLPLEEETGTPFCEIDPKSIYKKIADTGVWSVAGVRHYIQRANTFMSWYFSTFKGSYRKKFLNTFDVDIVQNTADTVFFKENEVVFELVDFPVEQGYLQLVIAGLVWSGASNKEVVGTLESNVVFSDGVIQFGKRTITYPGFVDAIRYYEMHDSYVRFAGGRRYDIVKRPGDTFIRRTDYREKLLENGLSPTYLNFLYIDFDGNMKRKMSVRLLRHSGLMKKLYDASGGGALNQKICEDVLGRVSRNKVIDALSDYKTYTEALKLLES